MLKDYSVRLCTSDDYHFIVPVRAGTPEAAQGYAVRFIEDFYRVKVAHVIVRHKGHALPTWCKKAQRVDRDAMAQAPRDRRDRVLPFKDKSKSGSGSRNGRRRAQG